MREKVNRSSCYEPQTWLAYQAGNLEDSERLAMEEHLLICEHCLEIYLNLIENPENDLELPALSDQFTDRVMAALEQEIRWQKASVALVNITVAETAGYKNANRKNANFKKDKETQNNRVNLLISYCAAASIAMFFWVGGYFADLSGSFSKGVEYLETSKVLETRADQQISLIQTGWTQKVIEQKPSSFIEKLIPKKE